MRYKNINDIKINQGICNMIKSLKNIKITLTYMADGHIQIVKTGTDFTNTDLSLKLISLPKLNGSELLLKLKPSRSIEAVKLELNADYDFANVNKIFANGFQSWTDSREFNLNEKIRKPGWLADKLIKSHHIHLYGDDHIYKMSGRKGVFHSHTYTYFRNNNEFKLIGSLSEKTGFTIIESDVSEKRIKIIKDCEGALWNDEIIPLHIFAVTGSENDVFDAYFSALEIKVPAIKPLTGWTSWYNYYQDINESIIMENLSAVKKYAPDFSVFQIDDGFQCAVGDWLDVDETKFPDGMKVIAEAIHKNNFTAGLWLAPFAAETNSKIFKQNPEWILKDKNGDPVIAGWNWNTFYALDFYNPQVRNYLKKVFDTVFHVWGYDLVKLDFLYAAALVPQHGKSRGQVMCEAMEFMRECAGDKLILGCGVPLGAAFGLVDYCRIGCDISLDWNDKLYMRFMHRERVSTLNALVNTMSRNHLNCRAFLSDPDVFLLREDNIKLTKVQKDTLFTINFIFGSLVFTSDNFNLYHEKQFKILKKLSGFSIKRNIEVKTIENLFFEINYSENGIKHNFAVNLNSKPVKFKTLTLKPFETRKIEI